MTDEHRDYQPVTERGKATRLALLTAAEEVFGEFSYDGASVAEITRRAGVAQGTFYQYFPDKKAAFIELVHQLNHVLRRTIAEAIADAPNRLAAERIGFVTFFNYVERHKSLYRIIRECEFVDNDTYRWHYTVLSKGYVEGLKRAQADGEIRTEISPDTLAWILMGIAESAGGRWVLWDGTAPPDQVVDEIMQFIQCALAPVEGSGP
ncbi:MAG: TetR/AcrR family transcriptional regulator [Acidimicrobiia bacterium]|nr:TetR/AcrR family transcriptional regulator [Acidimicrobiia bacterium]